MKTSKKTDSASHTLINRIIKSGIATAMCFFIVTPSHAVPTTEASNCSTFLRATQDIAVLFPPNAPSSFYNIISNSSATESGRIDNPSQKTCYFTSLPTAAPDTTCSIAETEVTSGTAYLALINPIDATYCLYQYDVDRTANPIRTNPSITSLAAPTNVPILSPLGLFALLSGLYLFANRRKKTQRI